MRAAGRRGKSKLSRDLSQEEWKGAGEEGEGQGVREEKGERKAEREEPRAKRRGDVGVRVEVGASCQSGGGKVVGE